MANSSVLLGDHYWTYFFSQCCFIKIFFTFFTVSRLVHRCNHNFRLSESLLKIRLSDSTNLDVLNEPDSPISGERFRFDDHDVSSLCNLGAEELQLLFISFVQVGKLDSLLEIWSKLEILSLWFDAVGPYPKLYDAGVVQAVKFDERLNKVKT